MKTTEIPTTKDTATVKINFECKSFIVHKGISQHGYTVTHKNTKLSVFGMCDTLRLAKDAARMLDTIPGWEEVTPDNTKEFFDKNRDLLVAIKGYAVYDMPRPAVTFTA